jgi:amino acid adenylation domain-containing protein
MSRYRLTPVDFNPFEEGKEIDKIVGTNEPQKEIWLSCVIGGDESNLAYNESVSLDFEGKFYPGFFTEAMSEVVARHESLRATVSANGESLIIYKAIPFETTVTDISHIQNQQELLSEFVKSEMEHLFNLQEGPLFRSFLHRLSDTHYYFTMVKHHVIGDGWSTGIILEDLSKLYNAKVKGQPLIFDPAPQISQYEAEMAAYQNSAAYWKTEQYWLDMYQGKVPVLDLPTDFPRPSRRTYKASRYDQHISPELISLLKKSGAKSGASLVNTLLSAFEIFLHLQTQQQDVVVGLPAAGQAATGHFGLVGHCVNVLPLKSHIDTEISFSNYLKQRKTAFFDAYDHQQFTFGELVKKLNIKRDPSRIPLVPVLFNIDMGMDNAVAFDGLDFKLISNPREYETFEIFLNATGSKTSFVLEWSYNTQLFTAQRIKNMSVEFEYLLQTLAANPALPLKELVVDQAEDRLSDLESWNNTKADYPKQNTVTQLITAAAKKYPKKTAVSCQGESLSYAELEKLSNQLAALLIAKGIQKGDLIGLSVDRSREMLIALLGILKSGAAYIPLDPEYPQDRIEYMLEDSGAKMLLVTQSYSGKFRSAAAELVLEHLWGQLQAYPEEPPLSGASGADLAYVLYTSGSTGKPKGVQIKHHNLVNFLLSMQEAPGITADDKLLAVTTISFDIAGLELYLPLISGAEIILADQETARDGRLLLDHIRQLNISVMQATPSTWGMMIAAGWNSKLPLKVLCGGEALPAELASALLERCDELWNMYGPTETTIWSAIKQITSASEQITIGRPIQNTQIYILNEALQPVAPENTGELYIGGEGLAAGYLNRAELTAERFINHPFSEIPGEKLYRTGDLARFLPNGEIQHQGRIDEQVKIRGYRIELGEIESLLAQQEGIKQAVVLAREDTPGDKRLVGYVTLSDQEIKDLSPSWKDHWDNVYDIAAEVHKDEDILQQNIDGVMLEQLQNSEILMAEAREWLEVSTQKIREHKPQHVYEIGCGGGQLMFEIAPSAKSYLATDYSEIAIEKLKEKLQAEPEKWQHVSAKSCAADDFSGISDQSFDLIIIHSVAQYFPDTAYFLNVIRESVKKIKAGGCLYIGDMQGKNSLEMEHAMNQIGHSKAGSTLAEFKEIVENRVRIENEFVADPGFFYLLPTLIPAITGVDVELRKGHLDNQTTKFHYDIWIYVNSDHQQVTADWSISHHELPSMDFLVKKLENDRPLIAEIKNIYNARTAQDHALLNWMQEAPADALIDEIQEKLPTVHKGLHPDFFWELGEQIGYNTYIRWTTDGTDGLYDVFFIPEGNLQFIPERPNLSTLLHSKATDFARTPVITNEIHVLKSISDSWKNALRAQLPEYMVPAEVIALKTFPLTPNKKIDRKSFPKPAQRIADTGKSPAAPTDEYEKIVSEIWSALLGIEQIGLYDDFFELGGHSLLAVRVMTAIEKETGKRLPLATLFEHSTIHALAQKIHSEEEETWQALVPIKTTGSKAPLFVVHGAGLNVLLFQYTSQHLDKEQPIYGLQALGLNHASHPQYTFEQIAEIYISEILKINPDGPYCLAGYSLGGFFAFEIARQLQAMGKKVKFIGILDTYAGDPAPADSKKRLIQKVIRQFRKIPFYISSFITNPKDALEYQKFIWRARVNGFTSDPQDYEEEGFTEADKEIYKKYDWAHNNYQLKPSNLSISVFNSKKKVYFLDDLKYLGWKNYANNGIKVYTVPGDHRTFLRPPNDKEFASILQNVLDQSIG